MTQNETQETTKEKELTPQEQLQLALSHYGKTHSKSDVIAAIEFLVQIGLLPKGYSITITFGAPEEQKDGAEHEN